MKKTESVRLSLPEQCALVVELSGQQKQLRKAVISRQKREQLSIGSLASRLELGWNEVEGFVNGHRAVCSGAILAKLVEYAGLDKMADKIQELAEKLKFSSRIIGVSVHEKPTIELIFALQQKSAETEDLNNEDFATAFGDLRGLVSSILMWHSDAYAKLADESTYVRIMDLLTSQDLEERLEVARVQRKAALKEAVDEMNVAIAAIRPRYMTLEQVCKALGVDPSTVYRARNLDSRASPATIKQIAADARKLFLAKAKGQDVSQEPVVVIAKSAQPERTSPVADEIRPPGPSSSDMPQDNGNRRKLRPTSAMLRDNAGGASEDGIKFILTSETFQEIDFHPGPRGIRFARSQLALTRALLNMFCQIKDPGTRATVRQALSAEVEELEYAIRMFSEEFPNNLLALHDAARSTMGRMRIEAEKKNKGVKK